MADDHPLVLNALVRQLVAEPGVSVAGHTTSASELLELIARHRPDVAVVDVNMPELDGVEVCRRLKEAQTATRVVLYTGDPDVALLERGLAADARGFVLKSSPPHTVVDAVRLVAAGQTYVDPTFTGDILRFSRAGRQLSERQVQVLQLVAQGRTTKAAAEELHLSPTTVRDYIDGAIRKLEAENRTHAVAEALRRHLIH